MKKKEEPLTKEALIIEGEFSNILARLHNQGIDPSHSLNLIFLRMGNSIIAQSPSLFNELVEEIKKTVK